MRFALEIVAIVAGWEALRFAGMRALRRRWQRSIAAFLQRHHVRLEEFRFVDRAWVRQALVQDVEIHRAATERAAATSRTIGEVRAQVEEWLDEIVPYFNLFSYYKIGAAAARAAVRICYEPIVDHAALAAARAAVPPGAVTVYVCNHRSNADYVVLSVGALRHVALSYAVGEWARAWPLDALFRSFGSYFVRRGEKDPLYHLVLRRYLQLVAGRGLTTAFFLEGGLSRDGALREPKIGLLDYLVGIRKEEPGRAIAFVPVGLNFDRVVEDRVLLADAGGRAPTAAEKLATLARIVVRAPGVLFAALARPARRAHLKYGYAAVGFGLPVSLDALLPDADAVARLPDGERRARVAALADALLDRVHLAIPATPVVLVARALLASAAAAGESPPPPATPLGTLRAEVRLELERLRALGRPVALGTAFDAVASARVDLAAAGAGDRARMEGEILDAEEAEVIVDMALAILARRGAVERGPGGVLARDPVLLRYYANSLEPPTRRAAGRGARGA